MSLPHLLRATVALLSVSLLASCATTHSSNDDPREWSFSPMVEANKFYTSGLSVEDYVKGKPTEGVKGAYVYFLCNGFMEAGDSNRFEECRRVYDKIAARADYKGLADVFATYREYLDIAANQFLLEQGRFKEVEKNLLPYLSRDAAIFSFDRSKTNNANFRMVALPILARAQRNTGGITEPVRSALGESNSGLALMGAIFNPRGTAAMQAERQYLLSNYAACYDKVSRSSAGGIGIGNIVSIEGSAAAMERILGVVYTRLQALCAYEAGLLEEARLSYHDLLNQPDVKHLRGTQRLAHFHLAQIALRNKKPEEAIKHLRSSIEALESERAAIDSEAGRLGYVMNKSDIYAQLVDLLVEQGHDAEAFEYAERGKARALIDMLGSKRSAAGAGNGGTFTEALRAVDEFDAAQFGLSAAASNGGNSRAINVRQDIARTNPELGSLITVSALPAAEVQKRLNSGETLVEFFGEGDRLFAFAVTQNRVKAVRLDAKSVAEHARAFRQSMTDSASRDYQQRGKRLYDVALAPAMPYADRGALTVVPHAELHYVPFAALHDGSKYLIQKVDLRLLPSASVLPFLGNAGAKGSGLLILGNPDLGNRSLDLPGAEEEARMLQRINRSARTLLRAQASETALRKIGPQFREIHFAMHGKFDSANAMSSGLYMTRDAENDGVLSVGELYDLQLDVDLVVLSACETALGDASKGDDVVGLNRGFLFAGARSIVSSLWEVDDNATRDLMVAFYKQRGKHGKAGGLRQAQLATLAKYPHPYYWAAFQMSGLF